MDAETEEPELSAEQQAIDAAEFLYEEKTIRR